MKKIESDDKKRKSNIRAKTDFLRTSRHGLSLQEYRVIYYAILRSYQDKTPFSPVVLSVADFRKLLGLKGKSSYTEIKKLGDNILNRKLSIEYKNDEGRQYHVMVWVKSFHYNAGRGTVSISINSDIAEYLFGTPYSDIDYLFLVRFKCQYSERLYELLTAFRYKDQADFELTDLRAKLALGENQYNNFYDLKKRVLLPALADINEVTDMMVRFEEIHGSKKKVTGIIFYIQEKKKFLEAPISQDIAELLDRKDIVLENDIVIEPIYTEEDEQVEKEYNNIPEHLFQDEERKAAIIDSFVDILAHGSDNLFLQALDELHVMTRSSYEEILNQRGVTGQMMMERINYLIKEQKKIGQKPFLDGLLEESAKSYKKGMAHSEISNSSKYMRTCISNLLFYTLFEKKETDAKKSLLKKALKQYRQVGSEALRDTEEYNG